MKKKPHKQGSRIGGAPKSSPRNKARVSPPQSRGAQSRPHEASFRQSEQKVYGLHACRAVFNKRPDAVIRAYVVEQRMNDVGDMLRAMAAKKLAYHVVAPDEMDRVCESSRHEGFCLLVKTKPQLSSGEFLSRIEEPNHEAGAILYLDGVGNPHNVGAMMRTMAHFGCEYLLLGGVESSGVSGGALAKIAEGGAEFITSVKVTEPAALLTKLAGLGYTLVGTSSHKGASLFSTQLDRKCVIVMGSEGKGISAPVGKLCRAFVRIPGTGAVDSLNVSVATGLLLSRYAQLWGKFPS